MVDIYTALVASALCVMAYTFFYEENPFFRFAEHTSLGLIVGSKAATLVRAFLDGAVRPMLAGSYHLIIPILLGLLMYTTWFRKWRRLSALPLALIVGTELGLQVAGKLDSEIIAQISATIIPPIIPGNPMATISNLVIILGTVCGVAFFIFTREHRGTWGGITRIGRLIIIVAFGANFANIIMTRFSWFLGNWYSNVLPYPGIYSLVIVIVAFVAYQLIKRPKIPVTEPT